MEAQHNWQERTELLLGTEKLEKLNKSHVLVCGLGGVGAYAAEQLARAGIGELTLVDSDTIQASNINRQLPALHTTIGQPKVTILSERFKDINPDLKIYQIKEYLAGDNIEELAALPFDYVIDAIDTLSPKVLFIYTCLKNKQKLVSSMGAGGKLDPSQIFVAPIENTHTCKLAFQVRKRLHKLGVRDGFKAVFSTEALNKQATKSSEGLRNKLTTVGTISYLPAIFGCYCASVVIQDLIQ